MTVGLIGLGNMGAGMAHRILAGGFPLLVHNRTRAKADSLIQGGAQWASTPAELGRQCGVVVTMLADDAASRGAYLSGDGVLARARPGTVFVECGTVSLAWIAELDAAARAAGCALIDAPVTGSKVQADSGQLLFLAGGDGAVLERVRPVLATMARAILHLGSSGSGALMKLVNNFMCGVQAAALAEAVAFIERSQLNREQALGVLLDGAPGSPLVKTLAPRMANRDYSTNFALELMGKDLAYAMAEAARLHLELGTAAAARAQFTKAQAAGLERKDFSAVVEVFRDGKRA